MLGCFFSSIEVTFCRRLELRRRPNRISSRPLLLRHGLSVRRPGDDHFLRHNETHLFLAAIFFFKPPAPHSLQSIGPRNTHTTFCCWRSTPTGPRTRTNKSFTFRYDRIPFDYHCHRGRPRFPPSEVETEGNPSAGIIIRLSLQNPLTDGSVVA